MGLTTDACHRRRERLAPLEVVASWQSNGARPGS
jgi:hypothetical protein